MDRQILAAELAAVQDKRKKAIRLYSGIALAMILLPVGASFLIDPMVGLLALLVFSRASMRAGRFVVVLGLVFGIVWLIQRGISQTGPAPKTVVSYAQIHTMRPAGDAWAAACQHLQFSAIPFHQSGPTTLTAGKGMDLISWGSTHLVDVRPSADHPGHTVVTVLGYPTMPMTLVDYGRSGKVNNAILAAVA